MNRKIIVIDADASLADAALESLKGNDGVAVVSSTDEASMLLKQSSPHDPVILSAGVFRHLISAARETDSRLEALREELESRIIRRTLQLTVRSDLLDAILNGEPLADILQLAADGIRKVTESGGTRILPVFTEIQAISGGFGSPGDFEAVRAASKVDRRPLVLGGYFAVPISKFNRDLGTVFIEGGRYSTWEDMEPVLRGFIPSLFIVLAQHKSLLDAPALMKNVDRLLEGLAT